MADNTASVQFVTYEDEPTRMTGIFRLTGEPDNTIELTPEEAELVASAVITIVALRVGIIVEA